MTRSQWHCLRSPGEVREKEHLPSSSVSSLSCEGQISFSHGQKKKKNHKVWLLFHLELLSALTSFVPWLPGCCQLNLMLLI